MSNGLVSVSANYDDGAPNQFRPAHPAGGRRRPEFGTVAQIASVRQVPVPQPTIISDAEVRRRVAQFRDSIRGVKTFAATAA